MKRLWKSFQIPVQISLSWSEKKALPLLFAWLAVPDASERLCQAAGKVPRTWDASFLVELFEFFVSQVRNESAVAVCHMSLHLLPLQTNDETKTESTNWRPEQKQICSAIVTNRDLVILFLHLTRLGWAPSGLAAGRCTFGWLRLTMFTFGNFLQVGPVHQESKS